MPGGPTALLVALLLVPGWIFTRAEGAPRSSRTSIEEVFHILVWSLASTGAAALGYVTLTESKDTWLMPVGDLSGVTLAESPIRTAWSAAALVAVASALAYLLGRSTRSLRTKRSGDQAVYRQEVPLWVTALPGSTDTVLTVDMKDGRQVVGYLRGHEVTDDRTPDLHLESPRIIYPKRNRWWNRESQPDEKSYSEHTMLIVGLEIASVMISPEQTTGREEVE